MQLFLAMFLIVAVAGAMSQQHSAASVDPVLPAAVQPQSETIRATTETFLSADAASLPDSPSYTTRQPSSNTSILQPKGTAGLTIDPLAGASETTAPYKQLFGLAARNNVGYESLIFVGGGSTETEAAGTHQRSDGSMSGSETNCGRSSLDKSEGSGWFNTLLTIASKNQHYCALGEGGFWKRGMYAANRAFAAHRYDSASFLNARELFGLGVAPSVPTYYYSYPGYAGDRFAARYASAVGRDALRNMFREFWPDISSHMLHRHP